MNRETVSEQYGPQAGRTAPRARGLLGEAEEVREELRDALACAGITLPSLSVDAVSYADEKPCPLLELGRCNVATARQIVAVLRAGRGGARPARTTE